LSHPTATVFSGIFSIGYFVSSRQLKIQASISTRLPLQQLHDFTKSSQIQLNARQIVSVPFERIRLDSSAPNASNATRRHRLSYRERHTIDRDSQFFFTYGATSFAWASVDTTCSRQPHSE
jgi:hypothetical protein